MASSKKRVRIELLDIAMAITIFLVIVGHTTSNTDTVMYRRVLYAFHMPLFFFLAGMATKPRVIFAVQRVWVLIAAFVASLAALILGTVVRGDACDLVLMCGAQYCNLLWFFANSISGTLVVLAGSMLLMRVAHEGLRPFSLAIISFIGMHTMGIFLLRKPMLQEILMPLASSWIPGHQLVAAIGASLAALVLSMGLCVVIEHYTPELLGQFPNYPSNLFVSRRGPRDAKKTS